MSSSLEANRFKEFRRSWPSLGHPQASPRHCVDRGQVSRNLQGVGRLKPTVSMTMLKLDFLLRKFTVNTTQHIPLPGLYLANVGSLRIKVRGEGRAGFRALAAVRGPQTWRDPIINLILYYEYISLDRPEINMGVEKKALQRALKFLKRNWLEWEVLFFLHLE